MEFAARSLQGNLPFLALMMGVMVSLLFCVGLGYHLLKLRYLLALQKQRIEGLENQMWTIWGGNLELKSESVSDPEPAPRAALSPDSTREKVLHLHGLGHSNQEIAAEAGIRPAEVDFLLKVNEHLKSPGAALALRKIS